MIFNLTARAATDSDLLSLQRTVKLLVSALAVLLLTGGAKVSAKIVELSETQLEQKLADPKSGLRGFVDLVEKSMISGEMEPVEALIEQDAILARATDGIEARGTKVIRDLFSDSTRRTWEENGITRDFAGTNFRFLRIRTYKDRAGLLFRSAGDHGSLNFFCFVLREAAPHDFRVIDIFTMGINEYASETLRRTYCHLAASLLGEEGRKFTKDNGAYVDSIEAVAAISQQLKAGAWEDVLNSAAVLPPAVKSERSVLLMRLKAAENYSVTSRAKVIEDWLKAFPDEMDLPLKLADHYITEERWDDAERVVKRLLDRTGGDARLYLQLGNINFRRERDLRLMRSAASRN